jgi:hypothetical protein
MTRALVGRGAAGVDETLELVPRDEPAGLAVDLEALELAGPEVPANGFDGQVQLSGHLVDGQESLSHRHDGTKG